MPLKVQNKDHRLLQGPLTNDNQLSESDEICLLNIPRYRDHKTKMQSFYKILLKNIQISALDIFNAQIKSLYILKILKHYIQKNEQNTQEITFRRLLVLIEIITIFGCLFLHFSSFFFVLHSLKL